MKCPNCGDDMVVTQTLADGKIEVWYCTECGYETKRPAR
ncbi:MAG: zf-TFIIB domain-containing protein [Clostridia bacterium]|nr:zf-TFIIB domain-containing protein [Clostridia bacterium]